MIRKYSATNNCECINIDLYVHGSLSYLVDSWFMSRGRIIIDRCRKEGLLLMSVSGERSYDWDERSMFAYLTDPSSVSKHKSLWEWHSEPPLRKGVRGVTVSVSGSEVECLGFRHLCLCLRGSHSDSHDRSPREDTGEEPMICTTPVFWYITYNSTYSVVLPGVGISHSIGSSCRDDRCFYPFWVFTSL